MRCQIGGTLRPGSGGILPGVFGKRNSVVCDVLEPVTRKQLSCSRPKSLRLTDCGDCGESLVSRNEVTCSWLVDSFWREMFYTSVTLGQLWQVPTTQPWPHAIFHFSINQVSGEIYVRYVTISRRYVLHKEELCCHGMESEKWSDIVIVVQVIRHCIVWLVSSLQLAELMVSTCDNTWDNVSVNANTLPTTCCCFSVGLIMSPSSQFIGHC